MISIDWIGLGFYATFNNVSRQPFVSGGEKSASPRWRRHAANNPASDGW